MKLFNRKPRFTFELTGTGDWQEEVILHDPHELIELMKREDYRFRNEYLKDTVTITKFRNNMEGKVYFAKQFTLPQEEGFDWLNALSSFFTKKVLPYELNETLSLTTNNSSSVTADYAVSEPLTLEDFEADIETSKTSQSNQPKSSVEETIKSDMIQLSKSEFEALQVAIEEQKAENLHLRQQIGHQETQQTESFSNDSNQNELQDDSLIDPLSQSADQKEITADETTNKEVVLDILPEIKDELDQELSKCLQSETEQVELEINKLDKRDQIKKIVTEQLSKEEHEQIEQLRQKWIDTKNEQLREEELRHKMRMEDITITCDTKLQEDEKKIHSSFTKKIEDYTQREYEKQTNKLIHTLQAKMEELQQTKQIATENTN